MKTLIPLFSMILVFCMPGMAQVGISPDNTPPDPSAMLEVRSTSGGLLVPRMSTAERDAIASPADALMIFNTTTRCFEAYNAQATLWESFHCFTCPLPAESGPISGPASVCDNSPGIVYSIAPIAGALGYAWSYSGTGFTITGGDNTPAITASFVNATPGILTVAGANACGTGTVSPSFSVAIDMLPPTAPVSLPPLLSQSYIQWNWSAVAGATGYRWSTVDDYGTSLDLGQNTSYFQNFLSCGTPYALYVWAYNSCGYSASLALTATTYGCCGVSMQVTHLILGGSGAPVNKTVNYETVSYPAAGSDKCWIARNLGAGSQASAWNDASESAAGWYYQFNRKQGYKHDGVNRTPNSAWITVIDDNSHWTAENDPCTLTFGSSSGWRLPTSTEWESVTNGSTSITDDFAGPLKIHAGGFLDYSDGSLQFRGSKGPIWSAYQSNMYTGINAYFELFSTFLDGNSKPYAFPLRCIRNF